MSSSAHGCVLFGCLAASVYVSKAEARGAPDAIRAEGVVAIGGGLGGGAGVEGAVWGPLRWSASVVGLSQPPLRWSALLRGEVLARTANVRGLFASGSLGGGYRFVGVCGPVYAVHGEQGGKPVVERVDGVGDSMWVVQGGAGLGWDARAIHVPITFEWGAELLLSGPQFETAGLDLLLPLRVTYGF